VQSANKPSTVRNTSRKPRNRLQFSSKQVPLFVLDTSQSDDSSCVKKQDSMGRCLLRAATSVSDGLRMPELSSKPVTCVSSPVESSRAIKKCSSTQLLSRPEQQQELQKCLKSRRPLHTAALEQGADYDSDEELFKTPGFRSFMDSISLRRRKPSGPAATAPRNKL
jgi:hypothetical protein